MQAEAIQTLSLGDGYTIQVSPVHRFGTDAILLADYARPRAKDAVCDLGSGCGILPLLWCKRTALQHIIAVELQADACALLRQSLQQNNVQERVSVLQADLRQLDTQLPAGRFDLVTMNPPYFTQGSGKLANTEASLLARHDVSCTFQDACSAAARLLRFGGRLVMCCRTQRLTDLCFTMRQHKLEPKRLCLVAKNVESAPWLALVEARKGAKVGLAVDPLLFLYDSTGNETPQLKQIYGDYAGQEGQ